MQRYARTLSAFFAEKQEGDPVLPIIRWGNGCRVIAKLSGKVNAKGLIMAHTVPDRMDQGKSVAIMVRQSTAVVQIHVPKITKEEIEQDQIAA